MFRDLKEYQEIAKIYAEKVSKPENLDERVRGGGVQSAPTIKPATPPQKGFGGGVGNKTNRRGSGARNNRKKPEKKMSNIPVIDGPVNNPEYGKNMSRSKEDLNPPEKKKPVVSTTTKQGKPRTKAQMMAAKRKADGKTIQQVKDENKASMIANARQRNVDFKAKRRKPPGEMKSNFAGGVSGKGKATDDFSKDPRYQSTAGTSTDIKKPVKQMGRSAAKRRQMMNKEEFTPYDIVLEYLLSSKQAATIEEANYIMTEMDAKTIQSIVAE